MNDKLIDQSVLEAAAPVIRTVAHPLRLRILDYLDHEGASNVSQIVAVCDAEQAVVSQQLRILKDQGILSNRREGNFVFYELKDRSVLFLLGCIRNHQCAV
jgi:DNA-binding transcriptional ArsR family regulator